MKKLVILGICLMLWPLTGCVHKTIKEAQPAEDKVRFSKVARGVWLHTSYKNVEPWGLVSTNGLLVERDDYSVLIDTAWNDQQTAQIVEWAKHNLNKPIRASIHTHAHADKMGGIQALHMVGVQTYASSMTNELAPSRNLIPARHDLEISSAGDQIEWESLSVLYPGGGHTEDNIVVYHKEAELLFGGCLIRPGDSNSLGYTGQANLENWSQATLNVAHTFPQASIVVPSHGRPGGREVLTNTIEISRTTP